MEQYRLPPTLHLRSNILDYLPTILDRCDIIIVGCHRNANEIFSIHNRWGQVQSSIVLNFSIKLLVCIIVDLEIFRKKRSLQHLTILVNRQRRNYIEI